MRRHNKVGAIRFMGGKVKATMKAIVYVLLAVGVFGACSIKEAADHMKEQTDRLKDNSDHLAKRTSDLENELTFDRSFHSFKDVAELLFGENGKGGSEVSTSAVGTQTAADVNIEPDLVLYATAAIKSLLFQFWKGDFHDSLSALDDRYELSADIFFVRLSKYIPRDLEVDRWMPDRPYKAIAALGARLDEVRPEYLAALSRQGLSNLSFYDVIMTALKNRSAYTREEILPKTTAKILQWEQEAIYVMQLRHNFLPLMALTRASDMQDRGDFGKAVMMVTGQKIDLSEKNPEQLREWTRWLRKALQTRADLKAAGIEPKSNAVMRMLLKSADFSSESKDLSLLKRPLVKEFKEAYGQILSEK